MTIPDRNQLKLFLIFYKSTLPLSVTASLMFIIFYCSTIAAAFTAFGFSYLSAGTVVSLTYKEISQQNQYYFYHNKGITKRALIISCALANFIIGLLIIIMFGYE